MLVCGLNGGTVPQYMRVKDFCPIGVEIEYEGVLGDVPTIDGWRYEHDGSLRDGGMEYVFRRPAPNRNTAEKRIRDLCEVANTGGWLSSIRTGIHIHVNALDWDENELRNVMLAYCLAEPMLYARVANERDQNPYCIPWAYAPQVLELGLSGVHLMSQGRYINARAQFGNCNKYAGLHIGPLTGFGTIEFRHMLTTLNPDEIVEWMDIVQSIVQYGLHTDLAALTQVHDAEDLAQDMLRSISCTYNAEWYDKMEVGTLIHKALPWYQAPPAENAWVIVKNEPSARPGIRRRRDPMGAGLDEILRAARENMTFRGQAITTTMIDDWDEGPGFSPEYDDDDEDNYQEQEVV